MLSAAIQTGELHADSSRNTMATIGDYSKSLTRVGDLRNFARSKRQRPAFLFDTLLPDNAEEDVTPQDSSAPAKSKGGRPAEYDWDAFTIEIILVANSIDGLPEKQSELIDQMLQWCENTWGQQPSLTSVKNRISQIYNGLGLGQKPTTP